MLVNRAFAISKSADKRTQTRFWLCQNSAEATKGSQQSFCQRQKIGAGWSSPVARQAHNLKAAGSNPAPATRSSRQNNQKPRSRKPTGLFDVKPKPHENLMPATPRNNKNR